LIKLFKQKFYFLLFKRLCSKTRPERKPFRTSLTREFDVFGFTLFESASLSNSVFQKLNNKTAIEIDGFLEQHGALFSSL